MRKVLAILSLVFAMNLSADEISLFDWGVYINGDAVRLIADLKNNVTFSNDFFETGLGTISISLNAAAPADYSVAMFFDYEIDEYDNTYYNEYGLTGGTNVDPRLLYEIDEPGFGTADSYRDSPDAHNYIGDIYDNFSDFSNLGFDNKIYCDWYTDTYLSDFENPISDDVSMAMGWNFSLDGNEPAVLEYTVSSIAPTTGFYLAQMDRNTMGTGVYLQSRLNIVPIGVPEQSILNLLGIGLVSLCFLYSSKRKNI